MSANDLNRITQTIKDKINLSDLIGKDVKLVRKGNHFSGLCPFHDEKSPSFSVNDQRGNYHCFGCGVGGDAFQYLIEKKNMTFREALEHLSSVTGIPLPKTATKTPQTSVADELWKVMEFCTEWFEGTLKITTGQPARDYLQHRGLSAETIKLFRLGYAPDKAHALFDELKRQGFSEKSIKDSGMVIYPEDSRSPYDRFRGRVMFPILDLKSRVIAFGGRILGDGQPKYLNSPETQLFHKGSQLYNLQRAREDAHHNDLLVVEGYMDVIGLYQHGFRNAVAPLGTAVTEEQISLLWKYADFPVFCLDGDVAGQKAAFRAAERALPILREGKSLTFCFMPDGEDPDSLCVKDVNAFKNVLVKKLPLSVFLWDQMVQSHPIATPEEKASFKKNVKEHLVKIADSNVRFYYIDDYKKRLEQLFSYPVQKKQYVKKLSDLAIASSQPQITKNNHLKYKILLATLLQHPYLIMEVAEELSVVQFPKPLWNDLKNLLLDHGHETLDALTLVKLIESFGLKNTFDEFQFVKEFVPQYVDVTQEVKEQLRQQWLEIWHETAFRKNLDQEILDKIKATKDTLTHENWEHIKQLKLKSRSLT